jgi:sugar/nucleoside kinase (ribokinase family)
MVEIIVAGNVNLETHVRVGGFPLKYRKSRFAPHGVTDNLSGVGYNVSLGLASLGHSVCLAAPVGRDTLGDLVAARLASGPVRADGIVRALDETLRSVILADADGRGAMVLDRKGIAGFEYPAEPFRRLLPATGWVYIAHTFWTVPLGRLARAAGKRVATDLQDLADLDDYQARFAEVADVVFFSAEHLAESPERMMRRLWSELDVAVGVCGLGPDGALLGVRALDRVERVPALASREVVCTTGAGDAMAAGFLSGLLAGQDPLRALVRAQVFAGHHVGEPGASRGFLDAAALDRLVARLPPTSPVSAAPAMGTALRA